MGRGDGTGRPSSAANSASVATGPAGAATGVTTSSDATSTSADSGRLRDEVPTRISNRPASTAQAADAVS